jgi:hypothetical protein
MGERARARLAATWCLAGGLLAVGALLHGLGAPTARAHLGHVVSRAERYLKLDASEEDTRLVVSLMLGPEEGERVLTAADADGDRQVTPAEAERYLAEWAEALREELPVEIDGEPVPLSWSDGWLDPIGGVRRVPLTVEMVARLPTGGREHVVVFEDRMARRESFDRTDVVFRGRDGAELLACGPQAVPVDCTEPEIGLVRGGAQPSTFGARIRYPRRPEPIGPLLPAALLAALATVVGLLAAARLRRRRGTT